jgi:hypothetical protein
MEPRKKRGEKIEEKEGQKGKEKRSRSCCSVVLLY